MIAALTEQGVVIHNIDVRKPSLNDAFLALMERNRGGEG